MIAISKKMSLALKQMCLDGKESSNVIDEQIEALENGLNVREVKSKYT